MAEITKIQWTDGTVNFWTGCKKVSPGCKYCYMYRDQERYGKDPAEVLQVRQQTINKILKGLEKRRHERLAVGEFEALKIFTCSWSDFFIDEADAWRPWAWDIIRNNPQFVWQILTKRIERVSKCLPDDWGEGWPNVWLGVSIEGGDQMNRLYDLNQTPARVKFVSFEPLIAPVYPTGYELELLQGINWAIIGGESGNEVGAYRYRPAQAEWITFLIDCLQTSGVSVFVKQLGTSLAKEMGLKDRSGGDISEWPEVFQVRDFPAFRNELFIS